MTGPRLTGLPASPGIAAGPAWRYERRRVEIVRHTGDNPGAEQQHLESAVAAAAAELDAVIDAQQARLTKGVAAIFEAQRLMLADPGLLARTRQAIAGGASAEAAWRASIEHTAAALEALPGPVFRARAADVRDVGERVLRRLLGIAEQAVSPDAPVVVVAEDLTPSDTVGLTAGRVLGLCTSGGGPTSHVAILARRLGVPAVVGLGAGLTAVANGVTLLVDGTNGVVVVEPDRAAMAEADAARSVARAAEAAAEAGADAPAVTRDGVRIEVAANVGGVADAEAAARARADGIGLLRTEFLYLDRKTAPDEQEQVAAYRAIIDAVPGKSVVVRTLDVGGDKPLPYIPLPPESNPFLGLRGVRVARRHPELLRRQLRAILRAGSGRAIRIMFPMISTVEEMRALREVVDDVRRQLAREDHQGCADLQVGMMVEVPSAALLAERFAPWVDFFSIGTNDLAQYTMAADRTNSAVAALADGLEPGVLRLIRMTAEAGAAAGKWVGVCGELAGDAAAVPVLIGLGVVELSMNPPAIPAIKAEVRRWTMKDAQETARRALALESARAVRALLGERAAADPP
ncbi:MAG TPA: phosphoenolpyruvate--protein phosphotransferase [bacterium]|nr:phosphoenolpyruvate--protein phosphotransferase [bacterium]